VGPFIRLGEPTKLLAAHSAFVQAGARLAPALAKRS
jgi:hypothetical protein